MCIYVYFAQYLSYPGSLDVNLTDTYKVQRRQKLTKADIRRVLIASEWLPTKVFDAIVMYKRVMLAGTALQRLCVSQWRKNVKCSRRSARLESSIRIHDVTTLEIPHTREILQIAPYTSLILLLSRV